MTKSVTGVEAVLKEFKRRRLEQGNETYSETKVGFACPYAIFVHENLSIYHPTGQAKFLEQPLRTEQRVMAEIVKRALLGRKSLKEAQRLAANHLIKVALPLVPVQTGRLRDSWFII